MYNLKYNLIILERNEEKTKYNNGACYYDINNLPKCSAKKEQ